MLILLDLLTDIQHQIGKIKQSSFSFDSFPSTCFQIVKVFITRSFLPSSKCLFENLCEGAFPIFHYASSTARLFINQRPGTGNVVCKRTWHYRSTTVTEQNSSMTTQEANNNSIQTLIQLCLSVLKTKANKEKWTILVEFIVRFLWSDWSVLGRLPR